MPPHPARIHVLLASHAPFGLVIRRGPSKFVATVLWDRRRDEFHLGQWLKGRIYERRSDLSADGKHFIYFAMNGKWHSETNGAWSAISRAPYLKALVLYPKGDCWQGGGLWTGKNVYWLNDGCGHSVLRDSKKVRRDTEYTPSEYFGGECPGVYYLRLLRDGWYLVERDKGGGCSATHVFERPLGRGWALRKIAHAEIGSPPGKGPYWDEHLLVHAEADAQIDHPDWEWAELDGARLVWASDGKLFSGQIASDGIVSTAELFDFNSMAFEEIEAPY